MSFLFVTIGVLVQAMISLLPSFLVFVKWNKVYLNYGVGGFYRALSLLLFLICLAIAFYGWYDVWVEYTAPSEWGLKANGVVLGIFAFIAPTWSVVFSLPLIIFLFFKADQKISDQKTTIQGKLK